MQTVRYIRLLLFFLIPCGHAFAQCPQPSFSIPDTVCINEPFSITNTSTGANRYEWDFCSGDMDEIPSVQEIVNLESAATSTNITTVFDGSNWYGFVSSRDNNKIFRLNFGNNVNSIPTVTELGNTGGILSRPEQIKIIKEGTQWIGLVVNLNNYVNDFSIVRLNFGSSLTNLPIATRLTVLDAHMKMPRGIEIISDQGNYNVFIANALSNTLTIVNFKNSLNNIPVTSDIQNIVMPDPAAGINIMGISIIKDCDKWFGLASSFNNRIYKLDFGNNLLSVPTISKITTSENLNLSPVKVKIVREDQRFFAIIMHYNGSVVMLDFGLSMDNQTPLLIKRFGFVGNIVEAELTKSNSDFFIFTVDEVSKNVIRYTFPHACNSNVPSSTDPIPSNTYYTFEGEKQINLSAYDNNGNISTISKAIYVRPQVTANFAVDKSCVGSETVFTASPSLIGNRILSYVWDFGNGNTASGKKATFAFPSDGNFPVKLTITDACSKVSEITKQVIITEQNTANFIAPATSCSNETIKFEDASTSAGDVIKKWYWDFGDGQTSTQQHPVHLFTEDGTFNVSLSITGESGCTEIITKSITIIAGAWVDFMIENACLGNETSFINLTTFSSNTNEVFREWNFGDNTTSTDLDPVHEYATTGNYTVTLTVRNNLSCTITKTKIVTVRLKPDVAFSYSLACSGEMVNFFDESISTDGSIKNWTWEFDDIESGTNNYSKAQQASHIFEVAGTYHVKLKIETIHGCIDSLTKNVIIIPSPQSAFSTKVNCMSKEVSFNDQSAFDTTNPITNWYWDFGDNNTSQEQHPVHTYNNIGTYTITLITTASSRCTNTYTKSIAINEPPVADFTIPEKVCLNTPVQFTDNSPSITDPITNWQWDFGSYGSSNEQHPQISFASAESIVVPVKLTITTAAGCSANIVKNITLQKTAEASFTYQAVSTLSPLSINFISTTNNTASVIWSFGDGNFSNLPNEQHTYESGGIYTVVLTAINTAGCSTIVQQEITLSNLSSNVELKLEAVSLDKSVNTTELQIRLVNNSPHKLNELELATLIDEKYTYNHAWQGELLPEKMLVYKYTVPVIGDESNNISSVCVTATSRNFNKSSNRQCTSLQNTFSVLKPFPNPADSEIHLPFLLPVKGEVQISIIDVLGRLQARYNFDKEAGLHQVQIAKGKLAPGLYFIEYDFDGKREVKSIIIN